MWNQELSTSQPALGVVPLVNLQAFSIGLPFGLALLTLLVSRLPKSRWRLLRDVGIVCIGVWPLQFLFSAPATAIDLAGASVETGRLVGTWLLIAVSGVVTLWAFVVSYRSRRADPASVPAVVRRDNFGLISSVVYLIACVVLWAAALPGYVAATGGVTPGGAPTGSFPYAVVTFVLSIAVVIGAYAATTGTGSPTGDVGVDPRKAATA